MADVYTGGGLSQSRKRGWLARLGGGFSYTMEYRAKILSFGVPMIGASLCFVHRVGRLSTGLSPSSRALDFALSSGFELCSL